MNTKHTPGMLVNHPYKGYSFHYFSSGDKVSKRTYSEYVNILNPEYARSLGGKHVIADVKNGCAEVIGLDPEADGKE